jgi:multiple antibiotic resistance protein
VTTLSFAVLAISSTVAVVEPFSTIAVYATLTEHFSSEEKRKAISRSMKISFLVLTFFTLTGHLVFQVFNITLAAFQIAGGILLVAVALQMLHPEGPSSPMTGGQDIAIVPLTFPLTAGPGTITTVILLASNAQNPLESFSVFFAIFVAILVSYAGMRYSSRLFAYLGEEGLRVMTAIMAIIVLAIAVQFMINGVADAFPSILSHQTP